MEPRDAWKATQGQLQLQLNAATYETWVAPARFVSCEDNLFTIGVPNHYTLDWLENRLNTLIQRVLSIIWGQQVSLKFIIHTPPPDEDEFVEGPLLKKLAELKRQKAAEQAQAHQFAGEDKDDLKSEPDYFRVNITGETRRQSPSIRPAVSTSQRQAFGRSEPLNPDFTFDNLVMGSNNQLAHAAAMAISGNPGKAYNPLFIHGGVGQGKSHLLQAIGHACLPAGLQVIHIHAETFTNDLVRAIRQKETEGFRDYYRYADVLLVDDIQFMRGKEATQEEFFHTFNALYNQNKQIVLTADRPPAEMAPLQERLRSRFEWGLGVELIMPDYDTRLKILEQKAGQQDIDLPFEVADLIANRVRTGIRELEGILNQVIARVALTRRPLNRDFVDALLVDYAPVLSLGSGVIKLEDILEMTARYHQLSLDDLLGKKRDKNIATARHVAIYLAREETEATLPEIGRALGGRTHSTILNSYRRIAERLQKDRAFQHEMAILRKQIRQGTLPI